MPNPPGLSDEELIFNEAIRIDDGNERARFLDGACRGNADLRSRIEVLLEAQLELMQSMDHDNSGSSLHEEEGSLVGPYKLLQQIGEGGFGVVYMAEQKKPVRRRVALKIIKPGMDTRQVIARFEAERQALALMDHPNIARVLDAGATDSGRPYFVMELVRGVAVTGYCDEHKLSTEERLKLFVLICQAIQHAHQKGIIHRDIKPGNVLVNQVDGQAMPKIIDFGVAKATQNDLTDKTLFTRFEQFIGTPAYMSPEQAGMGALDIDTRSDVYALGVLLYELLTGTTPLDPRKLRKSAVDEIRRRIREEEAVRPSAAVSTMDDITRNSTAEQRRVLPQKFSRQFQGDLDWIVLKALEKDRGRRYVTANALAQDLVRFMRNDPVEAMKPGLAYLLKKFAKKHRPIIAIVAAFAAILIAATTVSVGQAIRARKEESKAQTSYHEAREARLKAEGAEERERVLREEAEGNAYTASMRLVQFDWEKSNHSRLRETLSSQKDYPGKSFEWGYWQRALHLEKARFLTNGGDIQSIDICPQGDRVALVMSDRRIEVRSLSDGELITQIACHPDWAGMAIFSPDGETIASTDGKLFAGRVTLWNARTGEKIRIMGEPGEGGANSTEPGFIGYRQEALAFSPDGRFLATGGPHSRFGIQLWEVETGKRVRAIGEDWQGQPWIKDLVFSADGSRLLCRTEQGGSYIALYDVASAKRLASLGSPSQPAAVRRMSYLPKSNLLAVAERKKIAVYDLANDDFSTERDPFPTFDFGRPVFSPDGKWLLVKSGSDAHFFEADTGELQHTIRGAGKRTVFLPGGDEILSRSGPWLKRWDIEGSQMAQVDRTPSKLIQVSCDGSKALVIREDANPVDIAVVDLATGKVETSLAALTPGSSGRFRSPTAGLDGSAFSPDGQLIALGSRDGTIQVFDKSGDLRQTIATPSSTPGRAVHHYELAFGPSGKTIISTDDHDGREFIAIWDVETGEKIFRTKDHGAQFAISQDETLLASAFGEMVTLWDLQTGEQLLKPWKVLEAGTWYGVTSMTFTPDGQFLVTAGAGGTIRKWDVATGELVCGFEGHTWHIAKIAITPDHRRLVSAGRTIGEVRIWDLANGNELLLLTHPLLKGLYYAGLAISPDGSQITVAKYRDALISWETASDEQIKMWQAEEEETLAK